MRRLHKIAEGDFDPCKPPACRGAEATRASAMEPPPTRKAQNKNEQRQKITLNCENVFTFLF